MDFEREMLRRSMIAELGSRGDGAGLLGQVGGRVAEGGEVGPDEACEFICHCFLHFRPGRAAYPLLSVACLPRSPPGAVKC